MSEIVSELPDRFAGIAGEQRPLRLDDKAERVALVFLSIVLDRQLFFDFPGPAELFNHHRIKAIRWNEGRET